MFYAYFDDSHCHVGLTALLYLGIHYTKGVLGGSAGYLLRLLNTTSILKHMSHVGGEYGGTRI